MEFQILTLLTQKTWVKHIMTSEESQNNKEQTGSEDESNQSESKIEFQDIHGLLQAIDLGFRRGAFSADEALEISIRYNRLKNVLESLSATNDSSN